MLWRRPNYGLLWPKIIKVIILILWEKDVANENTILLLFLPPNTIAIKLKFHDFSLLISKISSSTWKWFKRTLKPYNALHTQYYKVFKMLLQLPRFCGMSPIVWCLRKLWRTPSLSYCERKWPRFWTDHIIVAYIYWPHNNNMTMIAKIMERPLMKYLVVFTRS